MRRLAIIVMLLLTACSEKEDPPPSTSSAPPAVHPFTGLPGQPDDPVVAVKIDDTANGRPQVGLDKADIVYVEPVEGGLTRLVAVYATNQPEVGPVRSVRASDAELLLQYGRITVAASGGAQPVLDAVAKSGLKPVLSDKSDKGFRRDDGRPAPYNVFVDLDKVDTADVKPRSIGLTWATAAPATAPAAAAVRAKVGNTPVAFQWDAAARKYVRVIDGKRDPVATPNVIVQVCKVTPDPTTPDVTGQPSQFVHTVGTGKVSVFRDGLRVDGTWSRPSPEAPTSLRDANGAPIPLAPGGAWILLVQA